MVVLVTAQVVYQNEMEFFLLYEKMSKLENKCETDSRLMVPFLILHFIVRFDSYYMYPSSEIFFISKKILEWEIYFELKSFM